MERSEPTAACVFPRCVDGEKPPHCGHDCDKREQPYAHEYGAQSSAAINSESECSQKGTCP